jgi:hypothetical protein
MAQLQAVWNKFNPRERLSAIGAGLLILSWIVGLVSYGAGAGTIGLLGALAVLGILYVKSTPTMNVTWPAPVSLIILAISGVVGLLALIDLLNLIRVLGYFGSFAAGIIVTLLLEIGGAALMLWGAWQEYQVVKPAMPNFGSTSTTTPPATPPTTPAARSAPAAPPAAPPADNTDEAPPA